ncbi:metacaspase-1-like [Zootermopsis nevadensis]|uniref:metacaspase-1-like n=1 Tax=Zootermopsis nevadensis TaxID=136037 RepID=UPI000B8E79ED|nr:metacaspase-1-like [Zootermopsis nevadensis]
MVQHLKIAVGLTVVAAYILLTLADSPKFDYQNNEGKVSMRSFPVTGFPGSYPGYYPGGFGGYGGYGGYGGFPGAYPGRFPGIYPGSYGNPFGYGYPSFGFPGMPVTFYSNKNDNIPAGNNADPDGKQ